MHSNEKFTLAWPGRPAFFRLGPEIVLAIPPQFQQFWLQRHPLTGKDLVVRPPVSADAVPPVERIGFSFHLPQFSGYTPENYELQLNPRQHQ